MSFPKPETPLGELFSTALRQAIDNDTGEKVASEMLGSMVAYLNLETVLSILAEHLEELGAAYLEVYRDTTKEHQLATIADKVSRLSERVGRNDPTA